MYFKQPDVKNRIAFFVEKMSYVVFLKKFNGVFAQPMAKKHY